MLNGKQKSNANGNGNGYSMGDRINNAVMQDAAFMQNESMRSAGAGSVLSEDRLEKIVEKFPRADETLQRLVPDQLSATGREVS